MGGSIAHRNGAEPRLWPALVDPTQIELIILNLAINARDAMEVGGALTVETRERHHRHRAVAARGAGGRAPMSCCPSATRARGMPPEVLAKAFEPFFTTKDVGKGSGLGLAQVYGFAKQSGGGVRIETELGVGTTVKVFLPRAREELAHEPAPPRTALEPTSGEGCIILLVDDDSSVREVTAAMLLDMGHSVVEAGSGSHALYILSTSRRVDLLLADYAMPGMNGYEVARAAASLRPDLPALFMTGYADLEALRDVGEHLIIRKPFRDQELERKIARILQTRTASNVLRLHRH